MDYTKEAKQVSKYKGFLSAMLASFPCAATFWCTYEYSKFFLRHNGIVQTLKLTYTLTQL